MSMIKKVMIISVVIILMVVLALSSFKEPKSENDQKILDEKPIVKVDEKKPLLKNETEEVKKVNSDQWAEISKEIAKVEEEINSDNFASLDKLKELLVNNPDYPKKKEVELAIKNWEQEKTWSAVSKQVVGLEKDLNSGNYKSLETVKELMLKNPTYPMKVHIDESIKRWEQEIVWIALTKQVEMMEYMLDKGIFTDIETIRDIMKKNPEYPKKKYFDSKIKKWDHELFLINVPL